MGLLLSQFIPLPSGVTAIKKRRGQIKRRPKLPRKPRKHFHRLLSFFKGKKKKKIRNEMERGFVGNIAFFFFPLLHAEGLLEMNHILKAKDEVRPCQRISVYRVEEEHAAGAQYAFDFRCDLFQVVDMFQNINAYHCIKCLSRVRQIFAHPDVIANTVA